jgi:hypothetical protein
LWSLAAGQNLGCSLSDFSLEFVELLLDDLLVIREVGLQPLEGAGIILGFEVFFEFVKLLISHLIG